jgi:hypothetical protein
VRVLDPAGAEVLVLGDNSIEGGYLVEVYDEGERTYRRVTTDSPFVHGSFEVAAALAGRTLTVVVLVTGPDWATISARTEALLEAVEVPKWRLEVAGKTWVCEVADSSAPVPPLGTNSSWRRVTLTIPARQGRGI